MASFIDTAGREWSLTLTVGKLRKLREVGVNLLSPNIQEQISNDMLLLVDIITALCRPQIEERGLSEELFLNSINGDVLMAAAAALMEAMADFFPSKREEMQKAIQEAQQTLGEN